MSEARYHDAELERMLENWRRYMTGDEYVNPLDAKISSIYKQSRGGSRYRTSSEPMILGDFRDIDAAIFQLDGKLQQAIRVDVLERNRTREQKAWACKLKSARSFVRRVDMAKRTLRAIINQQRQRRYHARAARAVAAD